jgi:hypothetical protein
MRIKSLAPGKKLKLWTFPLTATPLYFPNQNFVCISCFPICVYASLEVAAKINCPHIMNSEHSVLFTRATNWSVSWTRQIWSVPFSLFHRVHFNISLPTAWRFFDVRLFQQFRYSFIGTLGKLRKAAISHVISVRLSVGRSVCLPVRPSFRMEQLDSCWTDFYEIWYLCIFSEIHSFSILSDDRSKASSKTIPPHSAI